MSVLDAYNAPLEVGRRVTAEFDMAYGTVTAVNEQTGEAHVRWDLEYPLSDSWYPATDLCGVL